MASSAIIITDPHNSAPLDPPRKIPVPPGLYNFEQLARFFMEEAGVKLEMTKATGLIKLDIPESIGMIKPNMMNPFFWLVIYRVITQLSAITPLDIPLNAYLKIWSPLVLIFIKQG